MAKAEVADVEDEDVYEAADDDDDAADDDEEVAKINVLLKIFSS